jgi:hypothetical protein
MVIKKKKNSKTINMRVSVSTDIVGQVWWLTPVIPATWEMKIRRSFGLKPA